MIDTASCKSIEVICGESDVALALSTSYEDWATKHPLSAKHDWAQTEIKVLPSGQTYVSKRTSVGRLAPLGSAVETTYAELAKKRGFEWGADSLERVVPYWASDERKDRHGDRVEQTWEMDEYDKNPVMLFGHKWHEPPIGGILQWAVESREEGGYKGDALRLDSLFASEKASAVGNSVYRLVSAGFLKSGSVGFYPTEVLAPRDQKEREQLGLGEGGFIFRKNKLLEWSPCSVPANPGAHQVLSAASAKSLIRADDVSVVRELVRLNVESKLGATDSDWHREDSRITAMWKMVFGVSIPEHKELAVPFDPDETTGSTSRSAPVQGADLSELTNSMKSVNERMTAIEQTLTDIRQHLEDQAAEREMEVVEHNDTPAPGLLAQAASIIAARDNAN